MTAAPDPTAQRRADVLDDAYDRLADYSFLDGPGLAVHAPMAAEALCALGHDAAVSDWVEGYKARYDPLPAPSATEAINPADPSSWRAALGNPGRLTDWQHLFTRELTQRLWPEVIGTWAPRLLAGYGGAFTHGLLRTAHAVRALASAPAPSSLATDELAKGLALWAGMYTELPGHPRLDGDRALAEALTRLPRPETTWTPVEAGMFLRLGDLPDFADAIEALAAPIRLDDAFSDLTLTFARMMLANLGADAIGLVHTITPVAATRTLTPHLPTVPTTVLYAQLWKVNAAITVGFTSGHDTLATTTTIASDTPMPTADALIAKATEHRDPHVVKFTEACLNENTLRPDPTYLLAAQHLIDTTPAW
jgi:hypothetical protein